MWATPDPELIQGTACFAPCEAQRVSLGVSCRAGCLPFIPFLSGSLLPKVQGRGSREGRVLGRVARTLTSSPGPPHPVSVAFHPCLFCLTCLWFPL